ncbi:MAG: UDP-glucose 4-epimerase GalE [Clostridia bacterium]|nr:UDP-glucose 4-epimerase GalE [Clostridia bacterium]
MKILVTGGAGYIGSHLVTELLQQNYEVVVVDNLSTSSEKSLENIKKITNKDFKFYNCDIKDIEKMNKVFQENKIDAVVHFAAYSLVGESMTTPLKYYDNNIYGTKCLLESMIENNVKKIVFSSTAAVYGEPKQVPILETNETNPTNTYGETKLAIEKMMSWCDKAYGVKYVALRYFNACGAHPSGLIGENHNPESHLIPIILQVPNGKREFISVFGDDYNTEDGTCVRDYIHVCDLADAHILAVNYLLDGNESNVFNLGNGVGFSVKEVITETEKVVGEKINSKMAERRAGDPATLTASSQKAKDVLGWKPKMNNLNQIIATAWNWHKNHKNGFED